MLKFICINVRMYVFIWQGLRDRDCFMLMFICDPGSGVTKDPSKTFYFRDVLDFIFKRT